MTKIYTITKTQLSTGTEYKQTGTLEELIESYSYTLATGASYEHEHGNMKINLKPKTIQSLVIHLNQSARNSAKCYPSCFYELTGGV